jgi:hypothetical protein
MNGSICKIEPAKEIFPQPVGWAKCFILPNEIQKMLGCDA